MSFLTRLVYEPVSMGTIHLNFFQSRPTGLLEDQNSPQFNLSMSVTDIRRTVRQHTYAMQHSVVDVCSLQQMETHYPSCCACDGGSSSALVLQKMVGSHATEVVIEFH